MATTKPMNNLDEIRGEILSCKAQLGKLWRQLKQAMVRHDKQMENLRFLLNNRFNARGGAAEASMASMPADRAANRVPPNSRRWGQMAASQTSSADEHDLDDDEEETASVRSGSTSAAATDKLLADGLQPQSPVSAAQVGQDPADAAAAAPSSQDGKVQMFGPRALPIDEQADLPLAQASWHEQLKPIGYLRSCFRRKNAIPRQPNLCPATVASLTITCFANSDQGLEGLEQFSHVWLMWYFHLNENLAYKPKIRPPKFPDQRVGLFCTRSPHRPNPIGLSLVKLERVEGNTLWLSGVDMVDGTPILDVKPYLPWYDAPMEKVVYPHWVEDARRKTLEVEILPEAEAQMRALAPELQLFSSFDHYKEALLQVLGVDPRSLYRKTKCGGKEYALVLDRTEVFCHFEVAKAIVFKVELHRPRPMRYAGHLTKLADEALASRDQEQADSEDEDEEAEEAEGGEIAASAAVLADQ